ncbi:MAG: SulP family inorganic anion transporter [Bacteroidota bacterium]|jgi:MFS superfamily sulfate permease-like transporter|uniref:SulP family inorganic anion transporter n=1 Tax=Mucilaginibacter sp. TaxID=1882438 RepID=UPI0033496D71
MTILSKIKHDLPAGLVVFLVALPLCLGIAMASGAPLLSGIISGIIGGIVVGSISGSQTSISGPAAGLAAVVLASISKLGGFEVFSSALLIAGALQFLSGIFKAGFIANYIPSNVIKGLLAAIGILLILKQIPLAFGYNSGHQDDFAFVQANGENTITHLYHALFHITPGAVIINFLSVLILVFWDIMPFKKIKFFPASLVVVLLGIGINQLFRFFEPILYLGQKHLVALPAVKPGDLFSFLHLPDLASLTNYNVWLTAVTIAIVASLETLLNLEAVDNIDPHKRQSPPNKELVAQGVGNILAGLTGGLPVTSVIVRSSVNINAGAKSKASSVIHGIFLLLAILFLSPFINLIPFPSLAAILMVTGYKLAKISIFKEMYAKGWKQFIPFVVTITAIIFTDLLIGILIGLAVSLFYLLKSNYSNPFLLERIQLQQGETIRLELPSQVSFLNKAGIKDTLLTVPAGSNVIIDGSKADFIDNDVLELFDDYKNVVAPEKQIMLNMIGIRSAYQLSDHVQFVNVLDRQAQQQLNPEQVVNLLKSGNERFRQGKWNAKYFRHQVNATSSGQFPMAVIISCIDSRTSPEIIFDASLGDILSIRIAGNIVSNEIIGSLELAIREMGVKLVVVMGHSKCGAVGAAINAMDNENIGFVTRKINPAIVTAKNISPVFDGGEFSERVEHINISNSIEEILNCSPLIRQQNHEGKVGLLAAYYDTATGIIAFKSLIWC